jgi:hypothetical protein
LEEQNNPTERDNKSSHTATEPVDIFQDETLPIQEDSGEFSGGQNPATNNRRPEEDTQDPSPGTSSVKIIRRDPETKNDNLSRGVIIEKYTSKNEGGWDAQVSAAQVTAELAELGLAIPFQTPGQLHVPEVAQENNVENSIAFLRSMLEEGIRNIIASQGNVKHGEKRADLGIDSTRLRTAG